MRAISTLPEIALDARPDAQLRVIRARHLFPPAISFIWLHRHRYLRSFAVDFVQSLSAVWSRRMIERALRQSDPPDLSLATDPAMPSPKVTSR